MVSSAARNRGAGGSDALTYEAMLERTAEALGRRPPVVLPVPVLSPRLSARWLWLLTDVPLGIARPLVDGLGNTVVVTDRRIEEHIDVDPTPFDEAVRLALGDRAER